MLGFHSLSANNRRRGNRVITDLFNGFGALGTYTGGPTAVLDNLGVLQTSPANVLPIAGGRLSYNLAEGATLGAELLTNPSFDVNTTGWGSSFGTVASVVGGQSGNCLELSRASGSEQGSTITAPTIVGARYRATVFSKSGTSGNEVAKLQASETTGWTDLATPITIVTSATWQQMIIEFTATTTTSGITVRKFSATPGTMLFDTASMRAITPIWLPTAANGSQLWPSQSVRTRKGSVAKYDSTFKGLLIEPARTNLFLNSAAPVTQNITTTAQAYTVSVIGSGSITVSGTAVGVATEAAPLTVTATAGTLICTYAATLTHAQVEAGAFKTSPITTAGATVTRPASNYTRPTAGVLRPNDWGIWGRVVPSASDATPRILFSYYFDALNRVELSPSGGSLYFNKQIAGTDLYPLTALVVAAGIGFEYQIFQSSVYGMGVRVKVDGGAWGAFALKNDAAGRLNSSLPSSFSIGALNSALHLAGTYPFTAIIQHADPKAQLEALAVKYP